MASDVQRIVESIPAESADDHDSLGPNWGERVVMAVATSLAVLIVTTIAVLMGMA